MITSKIAQILSPTRVVLAAGSELGVREGMEFIIYELTEELFDPETKESLGRLELHKGRVQVIHVQDKVATARTLLRKVYRPGTFDWINPIVREGRWEEEYERLPIDESQITAVKDDLKVRVGDLVRSVS